MDNHKLPEGTPVARLSGVLGRQLSNLLTRFFSTKVFWEVQNSPSEMRVFLDMPFRKIGIPARYPPVVITPGLNPYLGHLVSLSRSQGLVQLASFLQQECSGESPFTVPEAQGRHLVVVSHYLDTVERTICALGSLVWPRWRCFALLFCSSLAAFYWP